VFKFHLADLIQFIYMGSTSVPGFPASSLVKWALS